MSKHDKLVLAFLAMYAGIPLLYSVPVVKTAVDNWIYPEYAKR